MICYKDIQRSRLRLRESDQIDSERTAIELAGTCPAKNTAKATRRVIRVLNMAIFKRRVYECRKMKKLLDVEENVM
jgi:hypothetical protein